MTDRELMQQALDALESGRAFDTHSVVLQNLRTALEQQAEPSQWRDMVVVNLVREGVNKHKARELADHFAAQQQAKMRMPKVGDRVICLEDESLGTVESLTAGGSPDITFDDGSRGTYRLSEFAELFGYAEQRQQQAEPPPEWESIKNILDEYGLDAIAFVKAWKAVQQRAEPVAWMDKHGNIDHGLDAILEPEGWKPLYTIPPAAQRPWVGLTDEDCTRMSAGDKLVAMWAEAKLKERNHDC